MCEINYLGEGPSDDAIARKMILAAGGQVGLNRRTPMSGKGKSNLDRRLKGLNAGLAFGSGKLLVLRDLDRDANCPTALIDRLLPNAHEKLIFRIAVRSSEAWLLADADAYAAFCDVAVSRIPSVTDAIDDPKEHILTWIAGRASGKIGRYFVDAKRRGVPEWSALVSWNIEFIELYWDPIRAASSGRSTSLHKAMRRLNMMVS